jgi:NADH-quinone oxidoreductase subunit I
MVAGPHPLVEGLTETDYYMDKVQGGTPEQAAWAAAHAAPAATAAEEGAKTA